MQLIQAIFEVAAFGGAGRPVALFLAAGVVFTIAAAGFTLARAAFRAFN